VSHIPQRKEKNCLNCGTIVQGRYCQDCGQENVVPKETFWHMVTHFFYDITHFDSKFFETLKDLLFKPGFLSKEYSIGRRASYLHPVKMYVFTSAIFFLLFFSVFKADKSISNNLDTDLSPEQRTELTRELRESFGKDTTNALLQQGLTALGDTTKPLTNKEALAFFIQKPNFVQFSGKNYNSMHEYDSIQQSLPAGEKDGWFEKRLIQKVITINEKYRENPEEAFKKFGESLFHRLPYMLFVSLPLFALILRLIYVRRRKQFFYADHGVFTIHLYIFSFIILLFVFTLTELDKWMHSGIIGLPIFLLFGWLFYYLYRAMYKFYGQGWFKTLIKFLLTAIVSLLMMIILFLLFIFFSAYTL
jgi:hypothetical protein